MELSLSFSLSHTFSFSLFSFPLHFDFPPCSDNNQRNENHFSFLFSFAQRIFSLALESSVQFAIAGRFLLRMRIIAFSYSTWLLWSRATNAIRQLPRPLLLSICLSFLPIAFRLQLCGKVRVRDSVASLELKCFLRKFYRSIFISRRIIWRSDRKKKKKPGRMDPSIRAGNAI